MASEYRVNADQLTHILMTWDELIPGREKIHLIACGGTALTLLGYKPSTVDVDFLIPIESEYKRLIKFLEQAGYEQVGGHRWKRANEIIVFDLFVGNSIFTTGLLDSPLDVGKNTKIREFNKIYLGVLNSIDLIISKLFRGKEVDFQDCKLLLENEKINMAELEERYRETAKYETGEAKVLRNYEVFLQRLKL
ncbi:MAG: hypothetical protein HYZ84_07385 [Candidatus Omnitrophica bacterium]|nr:hypothetical protein [Candidatus Omnitrophota bacterium]